MSLITKGLTDKFASSPDVRAIVDILMGYSERIERHIVSLDPAAAKRTAQDVEALQHTLDHLQSTRSLTPADYARVANTIGIQADFGRFMADVGSVGIHATALTPLSVPYLAESDHDKHRIWNGVMDSSHYRSYFAKHVGAGLGAGTDTSAGKWATCIAGLGLKTGAAMAGASIAIIGISFGSLMTTPISGGGSLMVGSVLIALAILIELVVIAASVCAFLTCAGIVT